MKLGVYKNNKNEIEYLVRGIVVDATNERDGEECVLYHSNEEFPAKQYYIRELEEFKQKFTFVRNY